MPSKTTKGGVSKTHNRGSSTSSTNKLNLNVAPTRNKSAEKVKRIASDLQNHVARNTSPHPRQSHNFPHRAPLSPTKPAVIQVEIGGDDDEWVSSESGAVTPAEYEEENIPPSSDTHADNDTEPAPSTTPRGDPPPPPPSTQRPRPRPQSLVDLPRVNTTTNFIMNADSTSSPNSLAHNPLIPTHRATPQHSLTRPPSMRSAQPTRPHPLIRTRSYAPTTPTLAAPPTLTSDAAEVHTSASSSPTSSPHKGQAYVHTPIMRSPTSDHQYSHHYPTLKRQGSYSSVTSVATLPLPTTSAATASTTKVHGERQRTQSHVSTSAALFSLTAATHPHPPSRPPSPLIPIAFPPINPHDPHGERSHVMIPSPLVPPHASATAHQNPILEALQRVAEAKLKAGR